MKMSLTGPDELSEDDSLGREYLVAGTQQQGQLFLCMPRPTRHRMEQPTKELTNVPLSAPGSSRSLKGRLCQP